MKRIFTKLRLAKVSKSKITYILFSFSLITAGLVSLSNTSGPALASNLVTGAPFNGGNTCSKSGCHGGGSFGGAIVTELIDASSNVVTSYSPGASYTFRITFSKTSGTPQYGFQVTAATTANVNVNKWGTLPAGTHNKLSSSHNYVEQSKRLTTNVISIPWTAPTAGTGSVKFYTAGNLVNVNGGESGDQPVSTNLTVTETVLPVKLLYFNGSIIHGKATLKWETAQEINNKEFILEKSINGTDYNAIATIAGKGVNNNGASYSFTDVSFVNKGLYRLKQIDLDGKTSVFSVVELKNAVAGDYKITLYAHAGSSSIMFYNGLQSQKINIRVADLSGKQLYNYNATANNGDNIIQLPSSIAKGIMLITITTEDGIRTNAKIGIMN
jgi:hypothetical protein